MKPAKPLLARCAKCGNCIRSQYIEYPGERDREGRQLGRHIVCPWPINERGLALCEPLEVTEK